MRCLASLSILFTSVTLLSVSSPAQVLEANHPLSDGDPVTPDFGFGVVMDPDGMHAYVSLCGSLPPFPLPTPPWSPTWNNNKVVKVNVFTGAVVGSATVGDFPEDLALSTDAAGAVRHIYVANSSSGTVTCLSPTLQVVGTVPLTPCFGGTYGAVWPFGIVSSGDGTRVFVLGTGCGWVDVVDSDPLSGTFNQVVGGFFVPDAFGRLAMRGPNELVVPVTNYRFDPVLGFSDGATTGVTVVDLTNPSTQTTYWANTFALFDYPSITDVAVTPAGRVLAAVGFGNNPRIVEIEPGLGGVVRDLVVGPVAGNALHGVALSPDARTLVVTVLNSGELLFVDTATLSLSAVRPTSPGPNVVMPNEVAFTPDGSRVVVSLQNAEALQVWTQLPGFDLMLSPVPTASLGSTVLVQIWGVEAGHPYWIYASEVPGPSTLGPWSIAIGQPYFLLTESVGDVNGSGATPVVIPQDPQFLGRTFHSQGVSLDTTFSPRFSNGISTLIN